MERKLTAILSADVQGYSRLMGEDEAATIRTLTTYRTVMTTLITQHRGRVVDAPGDNLLAEFASAVDAVQGAVAIQNELQTKNAELADTRRMHYRIGINVGDVVAEGERIYGDGVNIAARVESLAEGGGICISGTVYDHIGNKLSLDYEDLGEQTVKNISKPVRVYRVRLEPKSSAPLTSEVPAVTFLLPDKPSIAVLPFTNLSTDPEQEYFSDGMTDDLITDLSKISGLFVIARNSVFTYKGKAVKIEEVGRKLGVRHVLEGSVRKAGNRVRINVQLIDAATGGHVWAERYDRELEDIFALQDEITQKIAFALKVMLTPEEQVRFRQAPTKNLEAYDAYLRGVEQVWRFTAEATARARQLFEQATQLDSQYAAAYAFLGLTYFVEWGFQWNPGPQLLERAFELAQKAVAVDDSLPLAHAILGHVHLWKNRQHEQAIAAAKRALALNPNDAESCARLGEILNLAGRPQDALGLIEKAMRLNPHYPVLYLFFLGHTYYLMERYEEAITALQRAVTLYPSLPRHCLAASYSAVGREEEARAAVVGFRHSQPHISLEFLQQMIPYKDPAVLERLLAMLRKAGLR
jgi:TolB-like protein